MKNLMHLHKNLKSESSNNANKRILIVDDEKNIRSFLKIMFRSEGYVVNEAENAKEGLNILEYNNIELITLDLGLPDIDGMQMLDIIREKYPKLPVIILSVRDNILAKKIATRMDVNNYIVKPFDAGEVLEAANKILV
ncbi:response regulator [Rickettsiales bacterium]|nr:response regulator [Rickettsiales bacterium]